MPATARRILVIDAPELVAFLELLLTAEGYRVETATSPEAARDRLATVTPGLIISDLRIWGIPPAALLDLLNGDPRTRGIPVLLCTGAVREVEAAQGWLQQRGVVVLGKPFDIDDLLAHVHHLYEGGARRQEGRRGQGS